MSRLVAVTVLALSCAWPRSHIALGGVATTAIVTDCVMTERLLDTGVFVERNPLLGKRPTDAKLVAMCGVAVASTWTAAMLAGRKWRAPLFVAVTAIEFAVIGHNAEWWSLW